MSTPITRPSGPTFLAAIRLSIPAPQPTSTTLSPGRNSPRLKGFPVPAKDSMEASGMPISHSSAYSSMRAKGYRCGSGSPSAGWLATSAYSSRIASRKVATSSYLLLAYLVAHSELLLRVQPRLRHRCPSPRCLDRQRPSLASPAAPRRASVAW